MINPGAYTIEHDKTKREPLDGYRYRIERDGRLVAHFWHDSRGDDNGIVFADGTRESCPTGNRSDFISGGGPEPLTLTPRAVEYLERKATQRSR